MNDPLPEAIEARIEEEEEEKGDTSIEEVRQENVAEENGHKVAAKESEGRQTNTASDEITETREMERTMVSQGTNKESFVKELAELIRDEEEISSELIMETGVI